MSPLAKKSWRDAFPLLLGCSAVLFAFNALYVWLSSLVDLGAMGTFLKALPTGFQNMFGMPIDIVATNNGRLAVGYVDPIIIFTALVWGVARGSDIVSGEIDRGTMEMLLAQPISRFRVYSQHAWVTILGCGALGVVSWLGTGLGLWIKPLEEVRLIPFSMAAANVAALALFLAGSSAFMSSWDRYRRRTIGIMGGFFIVSLILKVVGRMSVDHRWLLNITFMGAYEPQVMVVDAERGLSLCLTYFGVLGGLGMLGFVLGAIVFCHRDLPTPV